MCDIARLEEDNYRLVLRNLKLKSHWRRSVQEIESLQHDLMETNQRILSLKEDIWKLRHQLETQHDYWSACALDDDLSLSTFVHWKTKCEALEVMTQCAVCLTKPVNVLMRPCNHLCLCTDCLQIMIHRNRSPSSSLLSCPMCREPCEDHIAPVFWN